MYIKSFYNIKDLQRTDICDKHLLSDARFINGFFCNFKRTPPNMHWCAYVIIDTSEYSVPFRKDHQYDEFSVYGGITYAHEFENNILSSDLLTLRIAQGLTQIPENGIILGFDTAHLYDIAPLNEDITYLNELQKFKRSMADELNKILETIHPISTETTKTYKDLNFCIDQMTQLTEQIKKYKIPKDDMQQ